MEDMRVPWTGGQAAVAFGLLGALFVSTSVLAAGAPARPLRSETSAGGHSKRSSSPSDPISAAATNEAVRVTASAVPPSQPGTGDLIPLSATAMGRVQLALYGAPSEQAPDELALVDANGTEIWRGPADGRYPDEYGGITYEVRPGGIRLTVGAEPKPPSADCEAARGDGLLHLAVCGDPSRSRLDEIRLFSPDGTYRVLTGLVDDIDSWRVAWPSPEGSWVLAESSNPCDTSTAYLIHIPDGQARALSDPGGSNALGWLPDGRAVITVSDEGCSSGAGPGTYIIDPASDHRVRIHTFHEGGVFHRPEPDGTGR
jgi:hypothetical protein